MRPRSGIPRLRSEAPVRFRSAPRSQTRPRLLVVAVECSGGFGGSGSDPAPALLPVPALDPAPRCSRRLPTSTTGPRRAPQWPPPLPNGLLPRARGRHNPTRWHGGLGAGRGAAPVTSPDSTHVHHVALARSWRRLRCLVALGGSPLPRNVPHGSPTRAARAGQPAVPSGTASSLPACPATCRPRVSTAGTTTPRAPSGRSRHARRPGASAAARTVVRAPRASFRRPHSMPWMLTRPVGGDVPVPRAG